MRRILASLLAAGLLAAVMVVPATARTTGTMSVTFCQYTSGDYAGYGIYTIPWANEMPSSKKDLTLTVSFYVGKKVLDSSGGTFPAPAPDNVYTNELLPGFSNVAGWDSFTSIRAKFTGAFRDSATVSQPSGGWPLCP
jgi:hypothetical protein